MSHQSGHVIISAIEAPVGGKNSPVKVRDLLCLVVGFGLGAWLL